MNVKHFDLVARKIFAPIYPVIARNIVGKTGITTGICVDLGSGTGRLGAAISEICPGMEVILYDLSDEMLEIAKNDFGANRQISTRQGDAASLPFADNSVNLVVSRGSVFFWKDKISAFNEAYRILASGGSAFIGGGFGRRDLFEQILPQMQELEPDWDAERRKRIETHSKEFFSGVLSKTMITDYEFEDEDVGIWVKFQKR